VGVAAAKMDCQQMAWREGAPVTLGYFYTSTNRTQVRHDYSARPVTVLNGLCSTFPNHVRWMNWYASVVMHSEFLRDGAERNRPWALLPTLNGEGDQATLVRNWFPEGGLGHVPRVLGQAKEMTSAALLRRDHVLLRLAERQLQWLAGENPFCQSMLYGLGQNAPPIFSPLLGLVHGGVPDGMRARAGEDKPFWPASTSFPFKGMSLLAAARWLSVLADVDGAATVTGRFDPSETEFPELTDTESGLRYPIPRGDKGGRFNVRLPAGRYRAGPLAAELIWLTFPSRSLEINLVEPLAFTVSGQEEADGGVALTVRASGRGRHRFQVRAWNLELMDPEQEVTFGVLGIRSVRWQARLRDSRAPWVAVIVPDRDVARRKELYGSNRPTNVAVQ